MGKLALWLPWKYAYKWLVDCPLNRKNVCDAWFEGYYQSFDVRTDGNAVRYGGHRGGMATRLAPWMELFVNRLKSFRIDVGINFRRCNTGVS